VAPLLQHALELRVDRHGDHSLYTLRLDGVSSGSFDPEHAQVAFSFKAECPTDVDCQPRFRCGDGKTVDAVIDYLAKDYESFRRLMLDRMTMLTPGWKERNPADLGMMLVELLAAKADQLSYEQDAVGTEAYLHTARRRTSVRRHARLVDYHMHDGCNARTWIFVQAASGADGELLPGPEGGSGGTMFVSRTEGKTPRLHPDTIDDEAYAEALVFESMHELRLYDDHNSMDFYTWGDRRCCLPRGATAATLNGHYPDLEPGDVLLLEEMYELRAGKLSDPDPTHRHIVRLKDVSLGTDPMGEVPITELIWNEGDALPFPLCLSAMIEDERGTSHGTGLSLARGNMVLADHGRSLERSDWLKVPEITTWRASTHGRAPCTRMERTAVLPKITTPEHSLSLPLSRQGRVPVPTLDSYGATHTVMRTFDPAASAASAHSWSLKHVVPAIRLEGETETWIPVPDLLDSDAYSTHFVLEEHDSTVRFGDGKNGKRPASGAVFTARYRAGNGSSGNIGAETLTHAATTVTAVAAVRNPLPARGGRDAESIEEVRRKAPSAFRTQKRAVTPEDYARRAGSMDDVQRATARFRWTGSWHTVFVTIDRMDGLDVTDLFRENVTHYVEPYRMAGHDLSVKEPRYVSLEIELDICVADGHFRSGVRSEIQDVLSNRVRDNGSTGLFHPDRLSFGEPVYLSVIYATVQSVPGVERVMVTRFQRQGLDDSTAMENGCIDIGPLEIARLDNDPNNADHGLLRLTIRGGT